MQTSRLNRLRQAYRRQFFQPSRLSLLFNPYYLIRKGLYQAIKRHAHTLTGNVLDYGCGRQPYRDLLSADRIIGIDVPDRTSPHPQKHADCLFDGLQLPLRNQVFDSLLATEVLEHLFQPQRVLSEWHRVLKPFGFVFLTTPFVWPEHDIPCDAVRYTRYGLESLLKQSGFRIIEATRTGSDCEVILQLMLVTLFEQYLPNRRFWRILLTPLITAPANTLARILTHLLPKSNRLYLSHIVLAQKI